MPPLLTVVTVCLNAGDGLRETIECALSQRYDDFELLVKDGGSTDGSLERLPEDRRIRIVRALDRGLFDAMNQALDLAKGRFVNFLNAGDCYIDKEVLNDVGGEIRRANGVEFFYGDVIFPGFNREHVRYPRHLTRYFLYTNMLCHQGWFVSREAYLRLGKFKLQARIGCDQVFLYDAILGAGISYRHIRRFTVRYDVNGVSSTQAAREESQAFRQAARRQYYPGWERCLYRTLWGGRSTARCVLLFPPFLQIFRRLEKLRFDDRMRGPARSPRAAGL